MPVHFREERRAVLLDAMRAHPRATIVSHGPDGLIAGHLPLVAIDKDGEISLDGHVARANPHGTAIEAGAPAALMEQMLKAIVSFHIRVTTLPGKWTLSRNRPEGDRAGVLEGLSAERQPGASAVAAAMRGLHRREN